MRKLSPKAKTILIYILSFLLPALMMIAIYASIGITYGGKVTVLTFDLKAQYAPFIAGLRYLLKDPGKILFNWNASLGGNYMGVFAYYLASPLNLITLFWKVEDIADAMYVLIILKIALCGLTFNTFLHKRHPERGISFYNLIFSLCYALMSYNIAYGMCVMWLDAIILLPIVLLGIERILAGKKGGLFFISMTLTFITNYYMSYMVGVFAFLYFMCGVLSKIDKTNVKYYINCSLRFAINTLLGLGIAMPLILPAILNLKFRYTNGTNSPINKELAYAFRPLQILQKFLPSQYDSMYSEFGNPYVFCGSVMLILSILYFFQKRNLKEKLMPLIMLFIIFSGFFFEKVDYFWHGFTYPTGFPYRYSFLFSGLILLLAHESFFTIIHKYNKNNFIPAVLCIYTVLEIYMNGNAIQTGIYEEVTYDIKREIDIQNQLYSPLAAEIRKCNEIYRVRESKFYAGRNSESAYGINGTNFYASNHNSYVRDFLSLLGGATTNYSHSGCGFTPLADSLMGVRYLIGTNSPINLYNEIKVSNVNDRSLKLFENPNTLGIAYMIDKNTSFSPQWSSNPLKNQTHLLEYLGIDNKIYHDIPYTSNITSTENKVMIDISFDCDIDIPVLFSINGSIFNDDFIYFYFNDEPLFSIGDAYLGGVFELPTITTSKNKLRIEGAFYGNIDFSLCSFDKTSYLSAIKQLDANKLENTSSSGNIFIGTIDAGDGGTLFTTIPYDDGFLIYVDGIKTNYDKALDTFISIELSSGTHNIKFVYIPPGLMAGIFIMCISFIGSAVFYKRNFY